MFLVFSLKHRKIPIDSFPHATDALQLPVASEIIVRSAMPSQSVTVCYSNRVIIDSIVSGET